MKNKTVLVTGASSGIGLELCKKFAANHFNVVLVARSRTRLQDLAQELEKDFSIKTWVISADLSSPLAPDQIAHDLAKWNVQIDILVNNAGYGLFGVFAETSLKKELDMVQVNISALVHLCKIFLPGMVKRGYGKILNVASTAGFQPGPLMAVYYASKSFVLSFSEAIAEELEGSGVQVTALCPGPTVTGFQKEAEMEGSKLLRGRIPGPLAVAEQGYNGLMKGRRVVVVGGMNRILVNSVRFIPRNTVTKMVKKVQEKTKNPI